MKKTIFRALMILAIAGVSCGYDFNKDGIYAVINTSMGKMIFKLYYQKVPVTTGNFIGLAEGTLEFTDMKSGIKTKRPFYNGLIFHRVIKNFVIQGGCPVGIGTGGPGYRFRDEFHPALRHDSAGILSMANSGPGTNGSQFFITLKPTPHLNNRHTVFGKIVYGEDVMNDIAEVETGRRDRPVDDVVIESIEIVRVGEKAKNFNAEEAFKKGR